MIYTEQESKDKNMQFSYEAICTATYRHLLRRTLVRFVIHIIIVNWH